MEIYSGTYGTPLRLVFTFVIPVLVVVNVPARLLALPLRSTAWLLPTFAVVATIGSLLASRFTFQLALTSYRSASS
jgi:ABC-2 type transport system permease protein